MIAVSLILPIATQTPLKDYVGKDGCYYVEGVISTNAHWCVIGGCGMAVFRLGCMIDRRIPVKYIYAFGYVLLALNASTYLVGTSGVGWEKNVVSQFCMNINEEQADVTNEYQKSSEDLAFFKVLKISNVFIAQTLSILELLIYVFIIHRLWKSDQLNYQEGIITFSMKRERNAKNAITLKGQFLAFILEFGSATIIAIYFISGNLMNSSYVLLFFNIVVTFAISLTQLFTSHELKRFLRNHFNW